MALRVGSETARVGSLETEPLQRNHGRRGLSARGLFVLEEPYFRIKRRVLRHHYQVVDGIQAKADGIELFVAT